MKLSWLIFLTLVSCSHGSVDSCKEADWKLVGRIDEETCYDPEQKLKLHQKRCKKKFNKELWEEGRQMGSLYRCGPDGAYWHGARAYPMRTQCLEKMSKDESVAFQKAYNDGRATYSLRQKRSRLYEELRVAEEHEEKKASQKSSFSQEFGRWLFNTNQPRSPGIREEINETIERAEALEIKYRPPYATEYP